MDFFFCGHVSEVTKALAKTRIFNLDGTHAVMIWKVKFGEMNKETIFTKMVNPSSPATTVIVPDQPLPTNGPIVDIGQEIHYCSSCVVFYKSKQNCIFCHQRTCNAASSSFALHGVDLVNLNIQAARIPVAAHLAYQARLQEFIQSMSPSQSLGGAASVDSTTDDPDNDP